MTPKLLDNVAEVCYTCWKTLGCATKSEGDYINKARNPDAMDEEGVADMASIQERLQSCKDRIESLMPVVVGICGLLEAQCGVVQADSAARLSILALVFVPLAIAMGLFSMSDTYQPGPSSLLDVLGRINATDWPHNFSDVAVEERGI